MALNKHQQVEKVQQVKVSQNQDKINKKTMINRQLMHGDGCQSISEISVIHIVLLLSCIPWPEAEQEFN